MLATYMWHMGNNNLVIMIAGANTLKLYGGTPLYGHPLNTDTHL